MRYLLNVVRLQPSMDLATSERAAVGKGRAIAFRMQNGTPLNYVNAAPAINLIVYSTLTRNGGRRGSRRNVGKLRKSCGETSASPGQALRDMNCGDHIERSMSWRKTQRTGADSLREYKLALVSGHSLPHHSRPRRWFPSLRSSSPFPPPFALLQRRPLTSRPAREPPAPRVRTTASSTPGGPTMVQPPPIRTARGVTTSESLRRYTFSQRLIYDPQDHMGQWRQLGRWKGMEPWHEQQVCCEIYCDWASSC